jgi:putative ABC transport system permease protein
MMSRLSSAWRNLVHRDRTERDLDDEVRAAFELLVDEKMRSGLSQESARRAAAIELGGLEVVKQHVREVRSGAFTEALLQDVRYAARILRRSPLFTLTAVLSIGVGIAGTAVIFSLADTYLLRTRPGITDATRLVEVGRTDSGAGLNPNGDPYAVGPGFDTFSYPNYLDYRDRQRVFDGLAAYRDGVPIGLGTDVAAARVSGSYVSANFFDVLGVPLAFGRGFLPDEEQAAAPATVAVISDRLWRTQFDADRHVIGRTIRLNGRPFTIVGVTGPGFTGYTITSASVWMPLTAYPDGNDLRRFARRGQQWLMGIGRLKDGVTSAQARAEMARIARDLEREFPADNTRHGLGVEPSGAVPVGVRPVINRFVGLLFALVGLILVIACTNVAGMLLGRSVSRAREFAVRLALGAERRRVERLLVIESVLLGVLGGSVGLAGAWGTIRLVERLVPLLRLEVAFDMGIDWRVTAFSIALATVTATVSSLVPARAAVSIDIASATKRERTDGLGPLRARQAFVVAQVAVSVLLVVTALLLAQSLRNATKIDPGFTVSGLEAVGFDLRLGGYDSKTGRVFAETLMSRVDGLPGLEAAASAFIVPLTMETDGGRVWLPEEHGDERAIAANWNVVTPGYFRTIGVPLLSGRTFDASDRLGAPAVAIVNETFARRAWPSRNAVGQRLVVGASRRPLQVIGVARDAKYRTIGEGPVPFIYVPAAQRYESTMWILMRPRGPSLVPQVRALVREMDANLPIVRAATVTEMTAFGLFPQRVAAWLAALVGTIAMLLAAIGIYGVTAYDVSRRTPEIGLRVALGALRAQVVRLVVTRAMLLVAGGTALGLVVAAALTGVLQGLLYDVRPLDAISFAGGAMVLAALGLAASLIPATRAASANPVDALRAE